MPDFYIALPSVDRVVTAATGGAFDLGIGVDADGSDRLGAAEAAIMACPVVIDIQMDGSSNEFYHKIVACIH